MIIGAITDPELDGKMRVSIVATALDGQQPEAKSVINMVHRIHNRNPGYSDFSNIGSTKSFSFNNSMTTPISDGANALKLENEINNQEEHLSNSEEKYTEQLIDPSPEIINENMEQNAEDPILDDQNETIQSNGLENFGIDEIEESTPNLFNTENEDKIDQEFTSFEKTDETSTDEDDLEIPAFLRRQKN